MEPMILDAARERSHKPFTPEAPYDRFRSLARAAVGAENSPEGPRPSDARRYHPTCCGLFELTDFNVNLGTL